MKIYTFLALFAMVFALVEARAGGSAYVPKKITTMYYVPPSTSVTYIPHSSYRSYYSPSYHYIDTGPKRPMTIGEIIGISIGCIIFIACIIVMKAFGCIKDQN